MTHVSTPPKEVRDQLSPHHNCVSKSVTPSLYVLAPHMLLRKLYNQAEAAVILVPDIHWEGLCFAEAKHLQQVGLVTRGSGNWKATCCSWRGSGYSSCYRWQSACTPDRPLTPAALYDDDETHNEKVLTAEVLNVHSDCYDTGKGDYWSTACSIG